MGLGGGIMQKKTFGNCPYSLNHPIVDNVEKLIQALEPIKL